MSATDYPLTPEALLAAMNTSVQSDSSLLTFMDLNGTGLGGGRDVRNTVPGIYPGPWSKYTLYNSILGSPETELTEDGMVYAEHYGMIDCVIPVLELGDSRNVTGGDGSIGIYAMVRKVRQFFAGNFLGLQASGMEPGVPPVCYAPQNCYEPIPGGDEQGTLLLTGRLLYRVRTRPFRAA